MLLPLFPLNLVPFPGEHLNLHIFEERYKALVADCQQRNQAFAIAPYIDERLCEYGGLMRIEAVEKRYDDGRLDIRTHCLGRFRLEQRLPPTQEGIYHRAQVNALETDSPSDADRETHTQLLILVQRLYDLLSAAPALPQGHVANFSFRIGHKIGLPIEQEYALMLMRHEQERQQFLIDHLTGIIPTLEEMDRTKARIKLNGHFQRFDPLTF